MGSSPISSTKYMKKPKIVSIIGPTSSGKTSLSIAVAKQFDGEVISADSRQVYKGMNLGTGKVTEAEMQGVPHHLIDIIHPTEIYTAAHFKTDAAHAIAEINSRGHLPIIAGGTFFYLDVLRGKMQPAPVEPNEALRTHLETLSSDELFLLLQIKDSKRAETIDKDNRRRLIRSLEIIEELGTVPEVTVTESPHDMLIIGIDIDKETLHKNIQVRLHERFEAGMIDEVRQLHAAGVSFERLDGFGLEYRYITKYLKGELPEEEMKTELETKIRQFAKRQMTWLKRDKEIEWFSPENQAEILERINVFLHQT
jgi:tRNA dimethylallyltransferase